jgi:2-dehydro-3-deoxyphosphogluconate aldolase / (4S)-4-hydroxy-2-oxoglutarate aldolase
MKEVQKALEPLLRLSPVVAVLVIEDAKCAAPLARALVKGGVKTIEITLRTPAALEAMERIAGEVEDAVVGAGTLLSPGQFEEVERRGCRFVVSPGATPALLEAASKSSLPWLPGAATLSEMMRLLEHGYALQKFFPAEPAGGTAFLKSVSAVLSTLRFCPTGGIDHRNLAEYLALPNVLCVGGSWVAPPALVKAQRWDEIEALAASAVKARRE